MQACGAFSWKICGMPKTNNSLLCAIVAIIAALFGQGATPRCTIVLSDMRRLGREIEEFHRSYGMYPESLDEMCQTMSPFAHCEVSKSSFDPWGRRFSYTRRQSGYELYSNGPDGLPNTEDDIRLNGSSLGCALSPAEKSMGDDLGYCPCRMAARRLLDQAYEIRAFHHFANQYPRELTDLNEYFRGSAKNSQLYTVTDPWEEPYRYHLTSIGYELYSCGPDRLPNTEDDVYPGVWPEKCLLSLIERAVVTLSVLDLGVTLFLHAKGEYPKDLGDLSTYFAVSWLNRVKDPWRNHFQYGRIPSGYVLYSRGSDSIPQTDDDVYSATRSFECKSSITKGTRDILLLLELGIKLFRYERNDYPKDLSELDTYFDRVWLNSAVDQWGEPYRYSRRQTGYTLFSSGPDRRLHTSDDVFPGIETDMCGVLVDTDHQDNVPVTRKPQSGCGCSVCEY